MTELSDDEMLDRLVGKMTYARGLMYARSGAVRSCVSAVNGSRLIGVVQGGEKRPYVVTVYVTRSATERLTSFRSTCTCPVGINCKHSVALFLSSGSESDSNATELLAQIHSIDGTKKPPAPGGGKSRDWAAPLEELLDSNSYRASQFDVQEIGLQFELVTTQDRSRPQGPRIRVRPVVPGKNGNWVKSGISWANLEYARYRMTRSAPVMERFFLVKELLALSRLAEDRRMYGNASETVWLEEIHSRRVWDLLNEAQALGVPMMLPERLGEPIVLAKEPLTVTLDLSREDSVVRLRPRIGGGDSSLVLERTLLLGTPAHGVAWWSDPSESKRATPVLGFGPLDLTVDDGLLDLLRTATLEIPHADETRFLKEIVPRLRQRVVVSSHDRTVEVPDVQPTKLRLQVRATDDHRIGVTWSIGVDGEPHRPELINPLHQALSRSSGDPAVVAAVEIARAIPQLILRTHFGEQLAPEVDLEAMNAVRFMTELLPVFETLDGVIVERSGSLLDYQEAVELPEVQFSGAESSDNDWFDLTVTVTVGEEDVPFTTLFRALANEESHLILPSGTFFSLDQKDLRELTQLIAEARSLHDSPAGAIRLSRFQASLWEEFERLGVLSAQASAWESSVRSLVNAHERTTHATPTSLKATLRPYQLAGFNWLVYLYENRLGGVLADDMGLGKTVQALALICYAQQRKQTSGPFLVVAPTSVVGNWAAECHRFTPHLSVVAITETGKRRAIDLVSLAATADIVITSYSLFRLEYEEYASISWAGLFLDEAQFAKNRNSQTFQKAKKLPVAYKIAMSGTPIENNLMELWSLLSITAPGLFATPDRFTEYYRVPIEKHQNTERMDQLRRRVRPLLLRRTKQQVARDLPDKQEQILELDLNPKHKKIYQLYLQRERQKVLGLLDDVTKNRFEIFRSLTLLRQASLDVSLVDAKHANVASTKLDALMEMLEDIVSDGHRVLVFSQFTRFLTLARDRIGAAGIDFCYLDGRTRNRPAVINEFRGGDAPVFLISLKAGGFGLNLTEADYCILLDPWWNPATEAQAVDRVHRIGQNRKVMVYRLVAKDTIEEKVMAMKAKKAALFSSVMDGGGFESGAMTANDIRDLLE